MPPAAHNRLYNWATRAPGMSPPLSPLLSPRPSSPADQSSNSSKNSKTGDSLEASLARSARSPQRREVGSCKLTKRSEMKKRSQERQSKSHGKTGLRVCLVIGPPSHRGLGLIVPHATWTKGSKAIATGHRLLGPKNRGHRTQVIGQWTQGIGHRSWDIGQQDTGQGHRT